MTTMTILAALFFVATTNLMLVVDGAFLNSHTIMNPNADASGGAFVSRTQSPPLRFVHHNYNHNRKAQQQEQEQEQEQQQESNILDDGKGHVNGELADRIWHWEQQHRANAQMPKMPYSSRAGIRLVKDVVSQISEELNEQDKSTKERKGADSIESDLVQEGMIALMDAMNLYRQFSQDEEDEDDGMGFRTGSTDDGTDDASPPVNRNKEKQQQQRRLQFDFEEYARSYIQQRVLDSLEHDYYPGGAVPLALTKYQSILTQVQRLKPVLRDEIGENRDPTISELASRIGIPTDTLEIYLTTSKRQTQTNGKSTSNDTPTDGQDANSHTAPAVGVERPLSMESTVDIFNPLLDDTSHQFTDQEDWEHTEGHLLQEYRPNKVDQSRGLPNVINKEDNEESIDDYIDETVQHEGEDEMWVYENQLVAPLKEIIPDNEEPTPDDIVLSEMFKQDIDQLLTATLDFEEIAVVRLRFGLDSYKAMSQTEIGRRFNISPTKVHTILMSALEKLRTSYDDRIADMTDDDIDKYLEDNK